MTTIDAPVKKRFSRRKSLQLPPQTLDIPIPPSLLQSPYLNAESIFQRTLSAPHKPSAEDEQWLQDTVPLSLDSPDNHRKHARLSTSSTASSGPSSAEDSPEGSSHPPSSTGNSSEDSSHPPSSRPQSTGPHHAPPSRPLVRSRRLTPSPSGQPLVHSAPCIDDREYFPRS